MEIIFLGTSSGKTSLMRYHTSLIIKKNDYVLLIDTGDSISRALLASNIGFNEIDGIIFSHFHSDHFSGLPSLITQMKLENRDTKLKIYCSDEFTSYIDSILEMNYLFHTSLGFEIETIGIPEDKKMNISDNFYFYGKQNQHIRNKFEIKTSMPFVSLSFLFTIEKKNIFYSSDIGRVEDLYLFKNEKMDLLITEATHLTANEINESLRDFSSCNKVITHYPDEKLNELMEKLDRPDIQVAHDGKRILM